MTTTTKPERPHFTAKKHEASPDSVATRVNTAVTVMSGLPYTFSLGDFDLIGGTGEGLAAIHIAGLERCGVLTLCGAPVDLNEVVGRDEIEAGRLQFLSGHGVESREYDSFLFTTHDGATWSSSPMSMRIHAVADGADPSLEFVLEDGAAGPTAHDSLVKTGEGTAYTFKSTDFNFQGEASEFVHLQLTSLEMCGLLLFDGVEVTFGQVIPVEDLELDMLTFDPHEPGKEGFEFKVHDGTEWSESTYSMTIDVAAYYHPPTASDNVVCTVVEEPYVFQIVDFNYHDFDGDELARIQVTRMECEGAVRLAGVPINRHQIISRKEIDVGSLDFAPAGEGELDVFWFKVHDGTAYSFGEYRMSVHVTDPQEQPVYEAPAYDDGEEELLENVPALETEFAPDSVNPDFDDEGYGDEEDVDIELDATTDPVSNDPPAAATEAPPLDTEFPGQQSGLYPVEPAPSAPSPADSRPRPRMRRHYELTVTTREDAAYVFSATDLSPDSTPISEIQIISMEICGLLQLDGMAVTLGQRITEANFDEGRLTFIPAGVGTHKYFDFKVRRGPKWSVAKCSMLIEVTAAYERR